MPSLPRNPTLSYPLSDQFTSFTSAPSTTAPNSRLTCSICLSQNAKYTCPGCTTRICSLACSTSHKSKAGCTGQRNKVAYVPMNEYGWGKMMDDYIFLEDVSRKVGDWGKEIVRGGYSFGNGNGRDNRGRGRGRGGRGRGSGGSGGSGRAKRDVLNLQLEARDIDMGLLPIGMERRKVNQSSWDFKNQTALLTIEFKFHKPLDPLTPPSQQTHEPPFTLLTHKNNIKLSLLTLLRSHMNTDGKNRSRKQSLYPEWTKSLINPDSDDDPETFTNPQCVMQALALSQLSHTQQPAYHSFDPSQSLTNLLRHTYFVEFPTIEIWEDFKGTIVDAQGVVKQPEDERQPKRRKMNPKAGRLAINGLLGDYGSEDDKSEEEAPNVLAALDDYAESGEDDVDMGSDNEGGAELDPAILLELVRQARGDEPWAVEDDMVDWGDDI